MGLNTTELFSWQILTEEWKGYIILENTVSLENLLLLWNTHIRDGEQERIFL